MRRFMECDLQVPLALNGANIIANLSASNDLVGKTRYGRLSFSTVSKMC